MYGPPVSNSLRPVGASTVKPALSGKISNKNSLIITSLSQATTKLKTEDEVGVRTAPAVNLAPRPIFEADLRGRQAGLLRSLRDRCAYSGAGADDRQRLRA